jgi:hypothetical protein
MVDERMQNGDDRYEQSVAQEIEMKDWKIHIVSSLAIQMVSRTQQNAAQRFAADEQLFERRQLPEFAL